MLIEIQYQRFNVLKEDIVIAVDDQKSEWKS